MTHDWHWTFGRNCHVSFPGGGEPVPDLAHNYTTGEGSAAISDSAGNLLFHTDGRNLYAAPPANTPINPSGQLLGGDSSSCHSAILVPPAGGGSIYHVFAVGDWSDPLHIGPVRYTPVSVSPALALAAPTTALTIGPQRASERLAAVPHSDCQRYWVVSLDIETAPPGSGTLFAMRIDSDAGPSAVNTTPYPYNATPGYSVKFSSDGSLFALCSMTTIDILNFDRSTGLFTPHSQITGGAANDAFYGLEFSPNGRHLYFTSHQTGKVWRHDLPGSGPSIALSAVTQVDDWGTSPVWPSSTARIGALQLGPNGRIYGAKYNDDELFEISDPDNPTSAAIQFTPVAKDASGQPLKLPGTCYLGLPTFTRIADDCRGDRCARLAAQVAEQLAATPKVNALRPCRDDRPAEQPRCVPVDLPRLAPWTSIRWGDSACDCIEGDDTEVMHLTVCNPYRNLTLGGLTIHQLVVVDANGNPPPDLPDGTPSIRLTPVGPYCFDDLGPCRCVTREFAVRLRGAVPGRYRILVRGICFDACWHGDEEDCFAFDVCKD